MGFGGGCHWCTEAVFQSLAGITKVESGWIAADGKYNDFSEAVIVHFDETIITLDILLKIHLHTHSCSNTHQLRGKYRSAVYFYSEVQRTLVENLIEGCQGDFNNNIITLVLPMIRFKKISNEYINYYFSNPEKKFCKRYIEPKLLQLLENYSAYVNSNKIGSLIRKSVIDEK